MIPNLSKIILSQFIVARPTMNKRNLGCTAPEVYFLLGIRF